MGQSLSSSISENETDLLDEIDTIAANYILSMSPKNLEKMSDLNYCHKLRKVVSLVFKTHITGMDLHNLRERTKKGSSTKNNDELLLNEKNESVCQEVAKFYTSVANIYAAIFKVIEPKENEEICSNILSQVDLDPLYFDKYNYETKQFDSMTEKAKKEYDEDLDSFYSSVFHSKRPKEITSFSQINFSQNILPSFSSAIEESKKPLVLYGLHINDMIKKVTEKQKELVHILNQLFLSKNNKKEFRVHPLLTERDLEKLLYKTRKIIVSLFAECEKDQQKSKYMFDQFVSYQTEQTLQNQIYSLKQDRNGLVS